MLCERALSDTKTSIKYIPLSNYGFIHLLEKIRKGKTNSDDTLNSMQVKWLMILITMNINTVIYSVLGGCKIWFTLWIQYRIRQWYTKLHVSYRYWIFPEMSGNNYNVDIYLQTSPNRLTC